MKLLLLEDDKEIQDFLRRALSEEGYQVDVAGSAEYAYDLALQGLYDIYIVDLMLPGMDGLEFIKRCRGHGVAAPMLILSARRSVGERVLGFDKGGDDYLVKPFSLAELLARLRALLRRVGHPQTDSTQLQLADLEIDLLRRQARRGGGVLNLTPKEFSLLEYMCRNQRRLVTRTMILDHVWDMRFDPATNVVDVHIHRLRAKIDNGFSPKLIHTIRGAGYVLEAR